MWDFHWDVIFYDEVVARALHREAFANEDVVHEIIHSLVTKGVLEDKVVEFVFGDKANASVSSYQALSFAQDGLYQKMQRKRSELGCMY